MPKVGLACTETQLAEAREEGSSRGMAPLCPQPPHLPEGEEQPPACQHKRDLAQACACPREWVCMCLCKRSMLDLWLPGDPAVLLTSHGLRVTACLHRQDSPH